MDCSVSCNHGQSVSKMHDDIERMGRDSVSKDRSLQSAYKIVESIENENRRLRQMMDGKNTLIEEMRMQVREMEEEVCAMKMQTKDVVMYRKIDSRLRGEIESLISANKVLASEMVAVKAKSEFDRKMLENGLGQEKMIKQKILNDITEIAQVEKASNDLMDDYIVQIRELEESNDRLIKEVKRLRDDKVADAERTAEEFGRLKEGCTRMIMTLKEKRDAELYSCRPKEGEKFKQALFDLMLQLVAEYEACFKTMREAMVFDRLEEHEADVRVASSRIEMSRGLIEGNELDVMRCLASSKMYYENKIDDYEIVLMQHQSVIKELTKDIADYELLCRELVEARMKDKLEESRGVFVEQGLVEKVVKLLKAEGFEMNKTLDRLPDIICQFKSKMEKVFLERLEQAKSSSDVSEREREDMRREILSRDRLIEDLKKRLNNSYDHLKDLEEKESENEGEIGTLRSQLSSKVKEVQDLKNENKQLIKKCEDIVCSMISSENEKSPLSISDSLPQESFSYELKKLKSEIAKKNFEINEYMYEIETMRQELKSKNEQIVRLEENKTKRSNNNRKADETKRQVMKEIVNKPQGDRREKPANSPASRSRGGSLEKENETLRFRLKSKDKEKKAIPKMDTLDEDSFSKQKHHTFSQEDQVRENLDENSRKFNNKSISHMNQNNQQNNLSNRYSKNNQHNNHFISSNKSSIAFNIDSSMMFSKNYSNMNEYNSTEYDNIALKYSK